MDTDTKDTHVNGCIMNHNVEKGEDHNPPSHHRHHPNGEEEENDDSDSLFPPPIGSMSRNSETKTHRKVQWNDNYGNKLAEVLEYEPSDVTDSEDEDSDSCVCTIM